MVGFLFLRQVRGQLFQIGFHFESIMLWKQINVNIRIVFASFMCQLMYVMYFEGLGGQFIE